MADDTTKIAFIFLICFWTILVIMSNTFEIELTRNGLGYLKSTSAIESQSGWDKLVSKTYDALDKIPVVNYLTPLIKIMGFQYTDQIPFWLSMILNIFFLLTLLIGYSLIRG